MITMWSSKNGGPISDQRRPFFRRSGFGYGCRGSPLNILITQFLKLLEIA
ncbi:hypothetical protein LINPERHAP2_LOCUS35448 [Linum perenne]